MLVILGALFAGFLSGIAASVVGVGGGVVTTPMIRALGATPLDAVGSTVPAILPGALTGTWRYREAELINWRAARICGATGMVFAIGGAVASDYISGRWLMVATAALVLIAAARLGRAAWIIDPTAPTTPPVGAHEADAPASLLVFLGAAAGSLGGLLGVGGGIILTPGLKLLAKFGVKTAVATSLASVAAIAVTSSISHITLGHVDWALALPLAVGVVPGARLGANLTVKASERSIQAIAAVLLGTMGLIYLVRELSPLVG